MLKAIVCSLTRHKIHRHRVWHDGMDFRTRCRRCDSDLVRLSDGWHRFDPGSHGDERREAKPE